MEDYQTRLWVSSEPRDSERKAEVIILGSCWVNMDGPNWKVRWQTGILYWSYYHMTEVSGRVICVHT